MLLARAQGALSLSARETGETAAAEVAYLVGWKHGHTRPTHVTDKQGSKYFTYLLTYLSKGEGPRRKRKRHLEIVLVEATVSISRKG